jgi:hypothetical protein
VRIKEIVILMNFKLECLTTLYRALVYSPLSATQIPTLFFLSETILYWLKNDAVLEPFLTSTELKLLKVGERNECSSF